MGLVAFSLIWLLVVILKKYVDEVILSSHEETPDTYFFPDEPINIDKDDLLGRIPFVNDLYKSIVNYPLPSDSFVFGLHGAWGEGKTSVIHLLRSSLYKNQDIIVCEYDPWFFSSQEAIIKGFYESLYDSLNKKFFLPSIKKSFIKYQRMLSLGLKLSGIQFDVTSMNESIEDIRQRIEEFISSTGKKVVLLIDDIDRLNNKDELLQIFKIVKLSARMNNIIFLLSFDQNLISSYFKEDTTVDSSFLDKIIQNPVQLPAVQQSIIDKFLFFSSPGDGHVSAIDRLFINLQIDEKRLSEFDKEFVALYQTHIHRLFPTLRRAKRYLNGLYSTLPTIKNEVNLQDFLILELIRIFYPEVYKDIWKNPWYYVASTWSEMYLIAPFTIDGKEKPGKIKDHIDEMVKKESDSELLIELLKTIFPVEVKSAFMKQHISYRADKYRTEKRITHPEVFPKYFILKVPSEELSDEKVESIISNWNITVSSDIEARLSQDFENIKGQKELLDFIDKLVLFVNKLGNESAIALIKYLYKNINTFSRKGSGNFFGDEFNRTEYLILLIVDRKIIEAEIVNTLIDIIKETPSFELAVSVFTLCCKEQTGNLYNIYKNIQVDSLKNVLSERLTNHFINGRKDIFKEEKEVSVCSFILEQWGTVSDQDRRKVNDYVFSLADANPKYLGKIVLYFVSFLGSPLGSRFRYDELAKLYDDKRLYEKIKSHAQDCYSNPEEKSAIDLFINAYEQRLKPIGNS
jgi:predicted KAP-like P-loop ATPase